MKIAIIHDYFDKCGGGERLVLNLAKALKADVYTGFIDRKKTFDTTGVKIISLGIRKELPRLVRNYLIAKKFEKYRFPEYDAFLISGVWCITAAENHPSILYCHTPSRFLYDLREYFLNRTNFLYRFLLNRFISYWRKIDQFYMHKFDVICTNSKNVKKRILRFYGKRLYERSRVVYTGIETKKFYNKQSKGFYLSTSRLDELKRIDLIIEAFKNMPDKKLIIVSTGPEEKKLRKLAKGFDNIKFFGRVSERKLIELYATCKAVIVASKDEDLGLSAIEAQAAGKPVIAVKEGGFLETVNRNTGIFFEPTPDSLISAIIKCESKKWNARLIQKNVKRFDISVFSGKMKKIISKAIQRYKTSPHTSF